MTTAAIQARWRAKTTRQRVELYLPPETVRQMDEAVSTGSAASRAELVAGLVAGGLSTGSQPGLPEAVYGAVDELRVIYRLCSDRRKTKAIIASRIEKVLRLLAPFLSTGS